MYHLKIVFLSLFIFFGHCLNSFSVDFLAPSSSIDDLKNKTSQHSLLWDVDRTTNLIGSERPLNHYYDQVNQQVGFQRDLIFIDIYIAGPGSSYGNFGAALNLAKSLKYTNE